MPFHEIMRGALLGSSERMSADRAYQIGLVSEVVPFADLHDAADWAAGEIAASPPIAVQGTVRSLWAAQELSRAQALDMGKVIIRAGSDRDSLYQGQQRFASGERKKPRIR
jgi:enoyl-CoA hydratase/carnithine racemase